MNKNSNLRKAKKKKDDEFYTQLSDIENELRHYKEHFWGKVVYCNCDDPYESNFFKYFAMNFNYLGLKKLIATGYVASPIVATQLDLTSGEERPVPKNTPYAVYINEVYDVNGDGREDLEDVRLLLKNKHNIRRWLKGEIVHVNGEEVRYPAGDFRSNECITLLKQADIVVTNPPFSLFREYVAQLEEYQKKYVIWGNINAVTYKEIFPLILNNKLWLGFTVNATKVFQIPDYYEKWDEKVTARMADGNRYGKVPSITVFTNLDIKKRHEELVLWQKYNSDKYPKYDNYDAINVDKVMDIPCDYDGVMGVPITFMDKYNPDQFEIIDGIGRYSVMNNEETKKEGKYLSMINGKAKFFRIIIKKK